MGNSDDFFQETYRIQTTRLKDWDYSSSGWYFVTICTKGRECLLGKIIDDKMELSGIGKIAENFWREIPNHFPDTELDEFIIMPNHVHGIIVINPSDIVVHCRDAINRVSTEGGITGKNNPMLKISLSSIIRWYKGRTAFEIHQIQNLDYFQWQSRFYDHIIRNERSLSAIRQYIENNPAKWSEDENNPEFKDLKR